MTTIHQRKELSSSSTSSKRRVTFNPTVEGIGILSLDDYTPAEISAAWYSDEEMEEITRRCHKVLRKMEQGKSNKYNTRGLERHSTIGYICKDKVRSAAVAAVLEEQERQLMKGGTIDYQAIADAYHRVSSSCQMWARVMGNRDQQANVMLYEDHELLCWQNMLQCLQRKTQEKQILAEQKKAKQGYAESKNARAE